MGNEGDQDPALGGKDGDEVSGQESPDWLLGQLLIELGRKVQQSGATAVHLFTESEVDEERVRWFRIGWQEHVRAVEARSGGEAGHPDGENFQVSQGELIRFPSHPPDDAPAQSHPLPIVGAGDASVHALMPHKPRGRPRRGRPETEREPGKPVHESD